MDFILYGEEQYLIAQEIQRIVDKNVTFEKEMNTSYFDATKTDMEEIIADAQTVPFFSDKKVVVVHHADFLSAKGSFDFHLEILENYMKSPNESTILILVCNEAKLDNRKKIVKALSKQCKTLRFTMLSDFERGQFVTEQSKKRNLVWKAKALDVFYERVGYSPSRILNELDKLALYSNEIDKESVIALVNKPLDDDVFALFQKIIAHDVKGIFHLWNDFSSQNIEPIALIAMLASQYRFLYQVKMLQKAGFYKSEIARELSAHPYRVEKTLEVAYALSSDEIAKTLHDLADLDQLMKAGKIDKRLGFELFLMKKGKA